MNEQKQKPPKKSQDVYTLLVQVGRQKNDGLPEDSVGAALMCYAGGVDEAEAVRETVALIRQADLNPLDVTGYGTLAEQEAEGDGDRRSRKSSDATGVRGKFGDYLPK